VHLGAAVAVRELAHRLLGGGLHVEHQPGGGTEPYVERPPVEAALGAGAPVNRKRRLGGVRKRHRVGNDLQSTEADDRVGDHLAGEGDGRLRGQLIEELLERAAVASPGHLDGAGVVADQDELHGALQAQGLHPACDGCSFTDVVA
jgi:hypothetical protein